MASLNPLAFFGQKSDQSGYFAARMAMMLGECPKEIVIFRQINEGRLGSNQQENREKGFRKYMQEHFPDCKIVELNLYAKRPDEDEALRCKPDENGGVRWIPLGELQTAVSEPWMYEHIYKKLEKRVFEFR